MRRATCSGWSPDSTTSPASSSSSPTRDETPIRRRRCALDEGLGLWRGAAFEEVAFDDFARTEATRLEELRFTALEDRVDAKLRLGHHAELVAELEQAVAVNPVRERVRAQLMLALYRSGREVEALQTYQHYRLYLAEELGLEPSAGLHRLEEQILQHDPVLDWAPPGFEPAAGRCRELAADGNRHLLVHRPRGIDPPVAGASAGDGSALARHDAILARSHRVARRPHRQDHR